MKLSISIAAIAATASAAAAYSPTTAKLPNRTSPRAPSSPPTALHYRNYHASYYESVDVDGDRMSLLSLLDPPSPPFKPLYGSTASSGGRVTQRRRVSPVTRLRSVHDYHRHVLYESDQLCVVRFSAPWCQVCKSTDVAWERMASKIQKMIASDGRDGGGKVKFLSVNLDGRDGDAAAIKDMLQIRRVPQGIVHHASGGLFGQRVDLDRKNLSNLRKRLESYLGEGGVDRRIVLDGLHG